MNDTWGDWGEKGPHTMMEDEHTLTGLVREMYPGLPCFLFGHSMGSFIARDYIAKYGDELAGVTLCGTCGALPTLPDTIAALREAVDAGEGNASDPKFTNMLFGFMFARIEEPVRLGNEWICHSKWVQNDHAADPFDAFTKPTNNRSMLYFCEMMDCIQGAEWAEKVPCQSSDLQYWRGYGSGRQLGRGRILHIESAGSDGSPRQDQALFRIPA